MALRRKWLQLQLENRVEFKALREMELKRGIYVPLGSLALPRSILASHFNK